MTYFSPNSDANFNGPICRFGKALQAQSLSAIFSFESEVEKTASSHGHNYALSRYTARKMSTKCFSQVCFVV